jgi:hypothetical protein
MKNKFIKYVLPVILIATFGCEQFIEVELPGQDPRLVLNASLENKDTLKVYLTKSRGVLEKVDPNNQEHKILENGKIVLKSQDGIVYPFVFKTRSNPFENDAHYYAVGVDLKPNAQYVITAESPGFKSVSSEVSFPEQVLIKDITYKRLGGSTNSADDELVEISVKFEDPPGANFYQISGFITGKYIGSNDFSFISTLYPIPVNPIYDTEFSSSDVILFDDLILKGKESEIVFRTYLSKGVEWEIEIDFAHVSNSYFQYQRTSDLQNYNQGDFLSQPVLVYNNIIGGMGIFSAKNIQRKTIRLTIED